MIVYADGQRLAPGTHAPKDAKAVVFIPYTTLPQDARALGLETVLIAAVDESAANRYESHQGYDCILLNIPDKTEDVEAPPINIDIYINPSRLLFVYDAHPAVERLLQMMDGAEAPPFPRVLLAFFNLLTERDTLYLESIEEAIATLEDVIAGDPPEDSLEQVSGLRKKLLKQKRYFESLLDTLEDMAENTNGYLQDEQGRALRLIINRVDRQFHEVLNLRDYITQVRESYQAQLDISLNKTMKLFTVITTLFLPLTLVAGWYGMNLNMPEYRVPHMYPIIIVACILFVVLGIVYFRKNKWF